MSVQSTGDSRCVVGKVVVMSLGFGDPCNNGFGAVNKLIWCVHIDVPRRLWGSARLSRFGRKMGFLHMLSNREFWGSPGRRHQVDEVMRALLVALSCIVLCRRCWGCQSYYRASKAANNWANKLTMYSYSPAAKFACSHE